MIHSFLWLVLFVAAICTIVLSIYAGILVISWGKNHE